MLYVFGHLLNHNCFYWAGYLRRLAMMSGLPLVHPEASGKLTCSLIYMDMTYIYIHIYTYVYIHMYIYIYQLIVISCNIMQRGVQMHLLYSFYDWVLLHHVKQKTSAMIKPMIKSWYVNFHVKVCLCYHHVCFLNLPPNNSLPEPRPRSIAWWTSIWRTKLAGVTRNITI
jgi:hypothetical protein